MIANRNPRSPRTAERAKREKSDIERSARAAVNSTELRHHVSQIVRYMDPPADTAYPLEYAYHLLGDVRGKIILDFGCGWGENTLLLLQRHARVIALDISAALIAVAKARLRENEVSGDVQFVVASAHELPLPDNSVDVVFGMAILHHLDIEVAAQEVWRVLKPGGHAIFREPTRKSRLLHFVRNLIPDWRSDVSLLEHPLNEQEERVLTSGFARSVSRAFQLPHMRLIRFFRPPRKLVSAFYNLDRKLLDLYPSRLSKYAAIHVIELVK